MDHSLANLTKMSFLHSDNTVWSHYNIINPRNLEYGHPQNHPWVWDTWWHGFQLLTICEGNPSLFGNGFRSQMSSKYNHRCYLSCKLQRAVEQTVDFSVIWHAMSFLQHHCNNETLFCKCKIWSMVCFYIFRIAMLYTSPLLDDYTIARTGGPFADMDLL